MKDETFTTSEMMDFTATGLVQLNLMLEAIKRGQAKGAKVDVEQAEHFCALALAATSRLLSEGSPIPVEKYGAIEQGVKNTLEALNAIRSPIESIHASDLPTVRTDDCWKTLDGGAAESDADLAAIRGDK